MGDEWRSCAGMLHCVQAPVCVGLQWPVLNSEAPDIISGLSREDASRRSVLQELLSC